MKEGDWTPEEPKEVEPVVSIKTGKRIGPIAVWTMMKDGTLSREETEATSFVKTPPIRPLLRLIETPKPEPQPTYGRIEAREQMNLFLSVVGVPKDIYDLSVDRFTARQLRDSDYASTVQLWLPGNVGLHPELWERALQRLDGRRPEIKDSEEGPMIYFDISKDSMDDQNILIFGHSLAYFAGGLTKVTRYRYRNKDTD